MNVEWEERSGDHPYKCSVNFALCGERDTINWPPLVHPSTREGCWLLRKLVSDPRENVVLQALQTCPLARPPWWMRRPLTVLCHYGFAALVEERSAVRSGDAAVYLISVEQLEYVGYCRSHSFPRCQ